MQLWHASPRRNRASILAHGLDPDRRQPIWAIAGQPPAIYFARTRSEAERYVAHTLQRFQPRAGAGLADWDLWRLQGEGIGVCQDDDWNGALHTTDPVPAAALTLAAELDFQTCERWLRGPDAVLAPEAWRATADVGIL